jgi:trehalose 6-phosphate synthase/phosphatase
MPLLSQDRPGISTLVLRSRRRERAWLGGNARDPVGERRGPGRLLIVSNRLPFTVRVASGVPTLVPSSGGLVTALRGVHERGGTLWLGWSGIAAGLASGTQDEIDRRLAEQRAVGVPLTEREISGFYRRYANEALWPVLHDRPEVAKVDPADWATYRAVNARFAEAIARELRPGDRVWIHDYHLMLVPRLLRDLCPDALVGYFLHTPFPVLESLQRLPHRAALLDGLLGADMLGFHTSDDASRFLESVQSALGRITNAHEVQDGDRRVRVQACPISIDFAAMDSRAADSSIVARAAELRGRGGTLMLGVDRLDYTKGIPERLRAFAALLTRHPEYLGKLRLFQLAVPSREEIPAYRALRTEVETMVARMNERFGDGEWRPVEYVYGTVDAETLAMLYRAADVMVVTPLRDGMNLVAKEFVASRPDGDGVLVLSQHAGASAEMRAALLVDPTDVEGLADAYIRALTMSPAERRVRMRRMRRIVRRHDVHQWVRACLLSLGADQMSRVGRSAG